MGDRRKKKVYPAQRRRLWESSTPQEERVRKKGIKTILVVGVLILVLARSFPLRAQVPLGEGFYLTSGLVDMARTDGLGPREWEIRISVSHSDLGEPFSFPATTNEDIAVGFGATQWLELELIFANLLGDWVGRFQARIMEETSSRPALSLGGLVRTSPRDYTLYLVGGKRGLDFPLLGRGNIYAGVGGIIDTETEDEPGQVRDKMQGFFLGWEKEFPRWNLMLEWDGRDANLGASYRLWRGLRLSLAAVKLEGLWQEGERIGVAVGIEFSSGR